MLLNLHKHCLRVLEKIPGINMMQYATIQGRNLVMTPKVGTRSIRDAILASQSNDLASKNLAWDSIYYVSRPQFMRTLNGPETVLFVRDPLDRLHSCWKQKISWQRDPGAFYFFQYYPHLKPDMTFLEFLQALVAMKVSRYEKHFLPISYGLDVTMLAVTIVEISDINKVLSELLGQQFGGGLRSNATIKSEITEEESAFYKKHLLDRFTGDYELLELARSKNVKHRS